MNDADLFLTLSVISEKRLIDQIQPLDSCGVLAVKKDRMPNLDARKKGTGVLIGSDRVVTAAHTQSRHDKNFIGFGAQLHSDIYDPPKVLAKREVSDQFLSIGEDVIECELKQSISTTLITPIPILAPSDITQVTEVNLYGYGVLNTRLGAYEFSQLRVDLVRFQKTYQQVVSRNLSSAVPIYGSGFIDDGFSGGPVVATVNGKNYLAGIQIKERPLRPFSNRIMGKVTLIY